MDENFSFQSCYAFLQAKKEKKKTCHLSINTFEIFLHRITVAHLPGAWEKLNL